MVRENFGGDQWGGGEIRGCMRRRAVKAVMMVVVVVVVVVVMMMMVIVTLLPAIKEGLGCTRGRRSRTCSTCV